MKRPNSARRALATIIAALLALVGASVVATPPVSAASGAPTDLRVQAIYFQYTANPTQQSLVLSSMAAKSALSSRVWTDFLSSWNVANKGLKIYTATPAGLPESGHVFVVLGSSLSKSGNMTVKLERRLKVALKALAKYPNSSVLVSGGAARNGNTEAKVMRAWLIANGIVDARILVEATSASTVSNATNSMAILSRSAAHTSYTLISDASHIRRATILFDAAKVLIQERTGQPWAIEPIDNVAYSDSSIASRGPVPPATDAIIASNVASVFGVVASYRALVSSPPSTAELTSIKVTAPANRTYQVGQALDTTGLAVTAVFDNGLLSNTVTASAAISGFSAAKVGKVKVTVSYSLGKARKTATFDCRIVKAVSSVGVKLSTTKIHKGRTRAVVKVVVAGVASKVVPTGTVKFYLDGKRLKTVTLKAGKQGVVSFKLPRIARSGKHKVAVRYLGSSKVVAAKQAVWIKVKK